MSPGRIPQYRQLYETLRRHIVDGLYREGDLLPSENELCRLHGLTRPTVRKALDLLAHEAFIKRHQGLGSVVHKLPKGIGILSISGTTTAIGKENLETRTIIKPNLSSWPDDFPFSLSNHEREVGCMYFTRLRLVNGKPVIYDISFIPNINLPRFSARKLDNKSLFDILRTAYRIEIKGGEQYIKAINATDPDICRILDIRPDTPVLHLQRRIDTSRLNFYLYSILYCNTSDHSLYGIF
ncbi:MAG: GntR family transcriptional regulator [Bacteroidales bacterium]|nr:GntR family transcriptional regulator [Bacteroidales bacterium]